MVKINLSRLEKANDNLKKEIGKIEVEISKYTDLEISLQYSDQEGFVIIFDRQTTKGAPINASIEDFFKIAKKGKKINEIDLTEISF